MTRYALCILLLLCGCGNAKPAPHVGSGFNGAGGFGSGGSGLTITYSSVSPTNIPAGSPNTTITLNGSNFLSGSIVRWNGTILSSRGSGSSLTATASSTFLASASSATVTIDGVAGSQSITVSHPSQSTLSPSSVAAGAGNTTVTITGANFISTSQAQANATNITTSFTSSTSLTATIPSSMLTGAGTVTIHVLNGTAGSNGLTVTVTSGGNNPVPQITSISPDHVTSGDTNTVVTFTGTGFVSGSQIQLNGSNVATTYVSPTSLTCSVSTGTIAMLIKQVSEFKVINSAPGGGTSSRATFRGLGGTYALPNKSVFDVTQYGAYGDNAHDDTVAIRSAKAAAHTAGGGIVYFPAGTYAVAPQNSESSPCGDIFTFAAGDDNIVFCGSFIAPLTQGASTSMPSKIYGYVKGMLDPKTNWWPLSTSPGQPIGRFSMFGLNNNRGSLTGIQFRCLEVNGQAGYTGNLYSGGDVISPQFNSATNNSPPPNHLQFNNATPSAATHLYINFSIGWLTTVGANGGVLTVWDSNNPNTQFLKVTVSGGTQSAGIWDFTITAVSGSGNLGNTHTLGVSDGDGWDVYHKGLHCYGDTCTVNNVLVWNCDFRNFRGEILYGGGNLTQVVTFVYTNVRSGNASVVSIGAQLTVDHCILGGPGNDKVGNGIEPFIFNSQVSMTVTNNLIQYSQSYGVVVLGQSSATFLIDHNTFSNNMGTGAIGLSDAPHNVTISNNSFTTVGTTCIYDVYNSEDPYGQMNKATSWAINNNTFDPGSGKSAFEKGNTIITGLTFSTNELKSGFFLNSASDGSHSQYINVNRPFTIDHTTIGSGASETTWYGNAAGNNKVALWTNSTLPAYSDPTFGISGDEPLGYFGGGNSCSYHWTTDRQIFGLNNSVGVIAVDLEPAWYSAYPDNYTVTFYGKPGGGQASWSLKANAAWNTWGADLAVPNNSTGVTIHYSASTRKFSSP
jgi:hypothetical protein